MAKTGKSAKDIFASTTETAQPDSEERTAGRPPKHDETWTKATVVLMDRQIVFLDRLCADIREAGIGKGKPVSMNRAEIIRALVDALDQSSLDVTNTTSEEDLRERLLAALANGQE